MTIQANGADVKGYYEADVARTFALSGVTTTGTQTTDDDGSLPTGRYRILAVGLASGEECWINVGAFEEGSPISLGTGAGRKRVPLTVDAPVIHTHVRKGDSDRIGAIMAAAPAGTVNVYVTLVSTVTKKT